MKNLSHLRVLVVEDNKINQRVILGMLAPLNMQMDVVDTGQGALDYVQNNPCDMLLMDVGLEDMDGMEVTQSIRALSLPVAKSPIIGLTAHASEADRELCKEIGMNDCLTKPIDENRLIDSIHTWSETIVH